jgi:hypothetical protein
MVFELRIDEHDSDELIESDEEVEKSNMVVRRSERVKKHVERYSPLNFHFSFVVSTTNEDPKSSMEVVDSTEGKIWKEAMIKEMESLHKVDTWDLVELPNARKLFDSKWVFNKNLNATIQVNKYKD